MKKLLAVAAVTALFACNGAEAPAPAEVEEVSTAADVPDGGPVPGTYTVTNADGSIVLWTNLDDGTYSSQVEGAEPTTGTYTMVGRNYCFDPAGDEEGETCLAFSDANEDGSWVSTRPDGTQATVVRNAAEDAAAAE